MPKPEHDANNPTPTKLFLNGALSPREASDPLEKEKIDATVFGTLWINNPDLQKRLEMGMDIGHGLNMDVDPKTFYGVPGMDPSIGYIDWPTATPE